jgi:hypothetical protein
MVHRLIGLTIEIDAKNFVKTSSKHEKTLCKLLLRQVFLALVQYGLYFFN